MTRRLRPGEVLREYDSSIAAQCDVGGFDRKVASVVGTFADQDRRFRPQMQFDAVIHCGHAGMSVFVHETRAARFVPYGRLFPQNQRVLKINELTTNDVIEAAASTLIIGT